MCISLSDFASIATLFLFVIYVVGRVIAVLSVNRLVRDEVLLNYQNQSIPKEWERYGIVDDIFWGDKGSEEIPWGLIVSNEGIRNLKAYSVKIDKRSQLPTKKGDEVFSKNFLNINQAIAIHVEPGELFPSLIVEYESFDYMKVRFQWRDNLRNGVFSELIESRHTLKSFFYYFLK